MLYIGKYYTHRYTTHFMRYLGEYNGRYHFIGTHKHSYEYGLLKLHNSYETIIDDLSLMYEVFPICDILNEEYKIEFRNKTIDSLLVK